MAEFREEIATLNGLSDSEASNEFLRCCGSRKWAENFCRQRPFASLEELLDTANTLWWASSVEDWFEAFSAHPKIGDGKALKEKFSKSSWEGHEQSGANNASEDVLAALQQLNTDYELKNGFIFLICATGKSAEEMVAALRIRMSNDRETEIQIAAGEQNKITKLRLIKLLQSFSTHKPSSSKL